MLMQALHALALWPIVLANGARSKLFYIYEFPDIAVDTWPSRSTVLEGRSVWKHLFNENEGFGHHYNGSEYFETWQYSSFRLVLSRLLRSKYRTRDISKASLFFIPYDSGADAYVNKLGQYRPFGTAPLSAWALEHIALQPAMLKNGGYDHFFVHSSSLTAHMVNKGLQKILEYIKNATILTVENLPFLPRRLSQLRFIQPVPMGSMYHWRDGNGGGLSSIPALKPSQSKRDILVSFFGSAGTATPEANKLRHRIVESCKVTGNKARDFLDLDLSTICVAKLFDANMNRDTVDALSIVASYERSVYCMCPPGDSPIRRAIFDSLLAGCIPVIFQTRSALYPLHQYNWHLSPQNISSVAVILDATDSFKVINLNYIDQLVTGFSSDEVRLKQKAIAGIARRLQYSMPPDVRRYGIPSITEDLPVWDPPFEDAVDVILSHMMDKIDMYI